MDFKQLKERARLAWRILCDKDGNGVAYVQDEVAYMRDGEPMNEMMADHLVDMARVFSAEGHSGFSASYALSCLKSLLNFEPLRPLTGEESEWSEPLGREDGTRQNKRCGRVFMDENGFAYDIDGVVFRDPDGGCWTGRFSRVKVEFPYRPKTVYVDVPLGASDEEILKLRHRALAEEATKS